MLLASADTDWFSNSGNTNLLLFLQIGGPDHKENSLENASETMSTNSASSPVPFVHNHINDINDGDKRRHKSSSDDSKVSYFFTTFSFYKTTLNSTCWVARPPKRTIP